MGNRVRAVIGCPECESGCKDSQVRGCRKYVLRGEGELGRIVESVIVEHGEVCDIRWPDGSTDLWLRE